MDQKYAAPVWPPPRGMFLRRRPFPIGITLLLIALACLLIVGSLGLLVYFASAQYNTTLQASAAAQAHLTAQARAQAQGTAQANSLLATATAQVLATAQSNIIASATAQVVANAPATDAANLAAATVTALQEMYDQATSATPVLDDPLKD